jgi:hypothetical protein
MDSKIIIQLKTRLKNDQWGDWYNDKDVLHIDGIKAEGLYSLPIVIHELVEAVLCHDKGISVEDVDKFDNSYPGGGNIAGDDKKAPYHKEHKTATKIEKYVCRQIGLKWKEYDEVLEKAYNDERIER